MSKQTTHQVLQDKNVAQFNSYMTVGSKVFGISPASASLQTQTYVSGGISLVANSNSLTTQLLNAGSSSLDVSQIIGLIDVRLNPELRAKYVMNAALAAGSSSNAAYMLAYPTNTNKAGWVNGISPKNQ
jgi:hypothetical protein